MRRSLYVKDDDYRLSFLYGNFTTLTRFTELDVERVLDRAALPRCTSRSTRRTPSCAPRCCATPAARRACAGSRCCCDGGVEVHGQVVLCPGHQRRRGARAHARTTCSTATRARVARRRAARASSDHSDEPDLRAHTRDEAARVVDARRGVPGDLPSRRRAADCVHAGRRAVPRRGREPRRRRGVRPLDQAENGIGQWAALRPRRSSAAAAGSRCAPGSSSPSTARRRSATAPRTARPRRRAAGRRPRSWCSPGAYAAPLLARARRALRLPRASTSSPSRTGSSAGTSPSPGCCAAATSADAIARDGRGRDLPAARTPASRTAGSSTGWRSRELDADVRAIATDGSHDCGASSRRSRTPGRLPPCPAASPPWSSPAAPTSGSPPSSTGSSAAASRSSRSRPG